MKNSCLFEEKYSDNDDLNKCSENRIDYKIREFAEGKISTRSFYKFVCDDCNYCHSHSMKSYIYSMILLQASSLLFFFKIIKHHLYKIKAQQKN